MSVEIHIDALVLRGLHHLDPHAVAEALERKLTASLLEQAPRLDSERSIAEDVHAAVAGALQAAVEPPR